LKKELSIVHLHVVCEHAKSCRVPQFEVCSDRDIVLLRRDPVAVGEVWFFASVDLEPRALISEWLTTSKNDDRGTVNVRMSDNVVYLYNPQDILASCTFRRNADGTAQVIVPWRFRHMV